MLRLALSVALFLVGSPAAYVEAQVTLAVEGAHDGLTLDRVTRSRRALQQGRFGTWHDVDVVEPVCFVPCVTRVAEGPMQIALSRPGVHPSRVGDVLTLAADTTIEVALDDRSALRVAGWVTWIASFVAGLGLVTGGALAHYDAPTIVTGFALAGVGSVVGITLSFLNDATSVRVSPLREVPDAEPVVTSRSDAAVANEAVAVCSDIDGALLHLEIGPAGTVMRASVARVSDATRDCAQTALSRAEFARGDIRQAHVEIDEAGARTNDPDTLRGALAACAPMPPGSSLAVSVEIDGATSHASVSGASDETRACMEAALRVARFLPRERALDLHLEVPAVVDDASAIPPPPAGVEASVHERVEERHAAILACTGGAS